MLRDRCPQRGSMPACDTGCADIDADAATMQSRAGEHPLPEIRRIGKKTFEMDDASLRPAECCRFQPADLPRSHGSYENSLLNSCCILENEKNAGAAMYAMRDAELRLDSRVGQGLLQQQAGAIIAYGACKGGVHTATGSHTCCIERRTACVGHSLHSSIPDLLPKRPEDGLHLRLLEMQRRSEGVLMPTSRKRDQLRQQLPQVLPYFTPAPHMEIDHGMPKTEQRRMWKVLCIHLTITLSL